MSAKRPIDSLHTVSTALIRALEDMGLRHAFGVIEGGGAPFHDALARSSLGLIPCRHESGALFAAIEAALANDAPALVLITSEAGLINALSGALTARFEGAKLLLVSTATPTRGSCVPAGVFNYAVAMHDAQELPLVVRALTRGFASSRGFIAQLELPLAIQASLAPRLAVTVPRAELAPSAQTMDEVVAALHGRFALWVGHGARRCTKEIAALVERTNAPVISTPRAKGCFDENDHHFLGVSGHEGHEDLVARLDAARVERLLVLGSRLGELSSGHDEALIPPGGLVHVDLDGDVPGGVLQGVETLAVQAELGLFLDALLERSDEIGGPRALSLAPRAKASALEPREAERVRPRYLMQCLQAQVVDGSEALVLGEAQSSRAWINRWLRFADAQRYRALGMFCPVGHASAGVLGVAATGRAAVALVSESSFLVQNELCAAAALGVNAIWIVLNPDGGSEVDLVALAQSMGASARRVRHEGQLAAAIEWSLAATGPVVLDLLIELDQDLADGVGDHVELEVGDRLLVGDPDEAA